MGCYISDAYLVVCDDVCCHSMGYSWGTCWQIITKTDNSPQQTFC